MNVANAEIAADLAPSGTLRAAINLGNPVLAQGTADAPRGVTVDIARELASRLGLPLELVCFDGARASFEAMAGGQADICFLAVEPAREGTVAFTEPYVVIEGVFAVPEGSAIISLADVDREGVRISVNTGAAYDLFLTRTLRHATLVRSENGVATFLDEASDVAAGIRQPMTELVESYPGLRLLDGSFMEIRQALGTTRARSAETVQFLRAFIEELKAGGFIAAALSATDS